MWYPSWCTDFGSYVFVLVVSYIIITAVVFWVLKWLNWYDKIIWNVYLKNKKKYNGKKEPIYKFIESSDKSGYVIQKWVMQYEYVLTFWTLFLVFLIYPISIYRWKYVHSGSQMIDKDDENLVKILIGVVPPANLYEARHTIMIEMENKENSKEQQAKDNLNRINTEFNENYVE